MMTEKRCYNCKYYWEDRSVNACECKKADDMTEEEWEKYFGDDQPNCPYWEEQEDVDYEI